MHSFLSNTSFLSKMQGSPKKYRFHPKCTLLFQNAPFSSKMHSFLLKCIVFSQNVPFFFQNALFSSKMHNFLSKCIVFSQDGLIYKILKKSFYAQVSSKMKCFIKIHCYLPRWTVFYFSHKVSPFLPKSRVFYQNAPFSTKFHSFLSKCKIGRAHV